MKRCLRHSSEGHKGHKLEGHKAKGGEIILGKERGKREAVLQNQNFGCKGEL